MRLGQIAVAGFNKGAGIFNWVQGWTAWAGNLCSKVPGSGFLSWWWHKIPGKETEDMKTCFLKPVGMLYSSVKYFEWKWVPTWLVGYSKHAAAARATLQATDVFAEMRSVQEALSKEIKGNTSKPEEILVRGGEISQKLHVNKPLSNVQQLADKCNTVAKLLMAVGYFTRELSICAGKAFPQLLDRTVPWLQMGAGVYLSLYGIYETYELAGLAEAEREANKQECGLVHQDELHLRYANYALNLTYLAYSTLGMAGLYYGKDSGAVLNRMQYGATLGTVVVPLWKKYCEEPVKEARKTAKVVGYVD